MNEKQIEKKAIEEMAKHCAYYHNGNCKNTHPFVEECDLMCGMCGTFANLEKAGYRKQSVGEWIVAKTERAWNDAEYPYMHRCSLCGNEEASQSLTPYCPNCGAKMKGGKV